MPEHEREGMHYSFATIGGRTERGGRVTSGPGVKVCELAILGNTVQAFAVVGSMFENGDVITDSPHRQTRTLTAFVPVDAHGVALAR
jgi:hypothetical protein